MGQTNHKIVARIVSVAAVTEGHFEAVLPLDDRFHWTVADFNAPSPKLGSVSLLGIGPADGGSDDS